MNEELSTQPPQAMARELDISSATLRRWSDEFAAYLSQEASSAEGTNQRRYTDSDLSILFIIKELMNSGMTYEQVRRELASLTKVSEGYAPHIAPGDDMDNADRHDFEEVEPIKPEALEQVEADKKEEEAAEEGEQSALVAINGAESAVAFLTNTLTTLSDSQKSIINSQAANRELLGVLIQDNFNLKEENNRLRERILEVERDVAKTRQEEEWRREMLRQEFESKITTVQQVAVEALTAAQNVEVPEVKAVKTKPGCLGALFGGGDTQIVTVPRRRSHESREAGRGGPAPTASPPPPPLPPQRSAAAHPKPTFPPE
jgi:DNA-binding transcriptional MerR regulator